MINQKLPELQQKIIQLSQSLDRAPPLLLAVSKRQSVDKIREAYELGQRDFGENYLQEALEKQAIFTMPDMVWHYIGAIQSNKTRKIAEHFDWVHTVSDAKIAQRLSKQRPIESGALNICLQINIDNEASKSGLLPDISTLIELVAVISKLPNLKLRGLMCIPAPKQNETAERDSFSRMKQLLDDLNARGYALDTLSMGMSDDLPSAIGCGSTIVRVGTALFGPRE